MFRSGSRGIVRYIATCRTAKHRLAAIDRLVHHSIILEFDGASQRVKKAGEKGPAPTAV